MFTLAHWCLLLGAFMALCGAGLAFVHPGQADLLRRFARHVWAGRILSSIAWVWGAYALYTMQLDLIRPFRMYIPFATLALIPLTWFWLDDLLACRSVGGLLVLFPTPLLKLTDLHPSPARLAVVALAYLCVIAGMILILYPYYLRRLMDWLAAHGTGRRIGGGALLCAGLLCLGLGLTVLR